MGSFVKNTPLAACEVYLSGPEDFTLLLLRVCF